MTHKGVRLIGERLFSTYKRGRYHVADRGSRTYLCDCIGRIVLNGISKWCLKGKLLKPLRNGHWKQRWRQGW